jgi:hypothetical protein
MVYYDYLVFGSVAWRMNAGMALVLYLTERIY